MSVRTMARVWAESAHSGTHLLMLLAIADFADDDGNAYPSVGTLAEKCRMKPRNANVILAALKASGELEVRPNEGPKGTNRYRIAMPSKGVQELAGGGVQERAGVQKHAGLQRIAPTPAKACSKPLQRIADEPSMNHQEPPKTRATPFQLPEWVPSDSWHAWVEMRKAKRKPPTARAMRLVVAELDRLRALGHAPGPVLDQSTRNSWTDVYPLKDLYAGKSGAARVPSAALTADEQFQPELGRGR